MTTTEPLGDSERLDKLLARWNDIEESIKAAELFQGQVTIPAINELRYAGRQMIKAMALTRANPETPDLKKALANAEQYLQNADHDVVDGVIVFIIKRVAELNFRFGRDAIAAKHSGYLRYCDHVDRCKRQVEASRRVSSQERATTYKGLKQNDLPKLISGYADITNSEAILATEIDGYAVEIENQKSLSKRRLHMVYFFSAAMLIETLIFVWFIR